MIRTKTFQAPVSATPQRQLLSSLFLVRSRDDAPKYLDETPPHGQTKGRARLLDTATAYFGRASAILAVDRHPELDLRVQVLTRSMLGSVASIGRPLFLQFRQPVIPVPDHVPRTFFGLGGFAADRVCPLPVHLSFENTRLSIWEERDRLHICLQVASTDEKISEWWDAEARSMFADGFFDRDHPAGRLHRSVYEYAAAHGIIANAAERPVIYTSARCFGKPVYLLPAEPCKNPGYRVVVELSPNGYSLTEIPPEDLAPPGAEALDEEIQAFLNTNFGRPVCVDWESACGGGAEGALIDAMRRMRELAFKQAHTQKARPGSAESEGLEQFGML